MQIVKGGRRLCLMDLKKVSVYEGVVCLGSKRLYKQAFACVR